MADSEELKQFRKVSKAKQAKVGVSKATWKRAEIV